MFWKVLAIVVVAFAMGTAMTVVGRATSSHHYTGSGSSYAHRSYGSGSGSSYGGGYSSRSTSSHDLCHDGNFDNDPSYCSKRSSSRR